MAYLGKGFLVKKHKKEEQISSSNRNIRGKNREKKKQEWQSLCEKKDMEKTKIENKRLNHVCPSFSSQSLLFSFIVSQIH